MSKMPIGSFTAAQSTGIMICTGVCALFMRFITPMRPADLSDEDIKREKEVNDKGKGESGASENDSIKNNDKIKNGKNDSNNRNAADKNMDKSSKS
jgi:hypothetical protein